MKVAQLLIWGLIILTALVNLLGPAKKVQGSIVPLEFKRRDYRNRTKKKVKTFKVECPTTYLSTITFENGTALFRLTLSFDVVAHQRNHIELIW